MDEILKISENAVIRYFTTLSQFGYKKYSDVDKLMVLLFVEEILTGEMAYLVTQDDYKVIVNALYCLMGSTCMIDFPVYESLDAIIHANIGMLTLKNTGDSSLRISEGDNFMVEA